MLPIPSTVVTAIPSTAHNGSKQPFAEKCLISVKARILDDKLNQESYTDFFSEK